jgi:hypothetical protein
MRIAKCEMKEKIARLLKLFDLLNDFVEVGPITGIEFGMEQFAIGANLESTAARWNKRERLDTFAEFKNFGRQTDGLRRVVSNDAIFDRDFRLHPVSSFPTEMVRMWTLSVKAGKTGEWKRAPRARYWITPLTLTRASRSAPNLKESRKRN